jgi:hypothetical protein
MQSLWMLASALLFALMAACVKLAAARSGTAEILFFRSIVGVTLLFSYTRLARLSLATSLAGMPCAAARPVSRHSRCGSIRSASFRSAPR